MRSIHASIPFRLLVLLCLASPGWSQTQTLDRKAAPATQPTIRRHNFERWEKDIAAFEKADRENPPPKGGVLFVGSSTIVRWKTLATDFPGVPVINRGFGGNEIIDSTHFAERIIFPYEPRMILLRAGGNDIHAGKTAQEVFADFKAFVAKVHKKLPQAQIVYLALNPAPSRWSERDTDKDLDQHIEQFTKKRPYLKYAGFYDMTVTPDGKPREELFVADRLHFNAEGYKLLAETVRPLLKP